MEAGSPRPSGGAGEVRGAEGGEEVLPHDVAAPTSELARPGEAPQPPGQSAAAGARFEEALTLYRRISDPYSIGWALVRLARLTSDPARRRALFEEAKTAWEDIDRSSSKRSAPSSATSPGNSTLACRPTASP